MIRMSVVVPVCNTARHLERCLGALRGQDYPADEYEILAVDNNSTDESPAILARATGVRVLRERKQGSYAARNRAVREARGSLLAFTDSDCIPDRGWLRAIEAAMADPRVQVVLGLRRPSLDHGVVKLLGDYEAKKDELVLSSATPEVYYGFTNNMGLRRTTFDRYGPFVERDRGSDTIFVRRVVDGEGCGAAAFCPAARIEHAELDGIASYYRKMFTYGRSRRLYGHIMNTRPLTASERLTALRRCVADGRYRWSEECLLVGALAGGMLAWTLGSLSSTWNPPAEE